jgi:Family of unknown function (DUF6796)
MTYNPIILAGFVGIITSILVGVGEGLLHGSIGSYSSSNPYAFMVRLSAKRQMVGHFFAVLAAPFYLVGYWHVYKMLVPDGGVIATFIIVAACYGFILGFIWIGSRAMIGSVARLQSNMDAEQAALMEPLIPRYQILMESLLQVIRITTLIFSIGFVYLVLQGETLYPIWIVFFNPFVILILVFIIFFVMPSVGKFIMPIAMNVAQGVFFTASVIAVFQRILIG